MGMQESNVRPPATPNTLLETGAFIVEMSLFQSAGINRNIPTCSDHTCKYLLLANHQSSILTYSTSMQTKVKKNLLEPKNNSRCSLTRLMPTHALIREEEEKVLMKRSFVCRIINHKNI